MGNAGSGTNGSQLFLCTVPTGWLDGEQLVIGKVVKRMNEIRFDGTEI